MFQRQLDYLSVVVPCFNEAETILVSHARLTDALRSAARAGQMGRYEIVYVDDGSKDATLGILKELFRKDEHVRVIELRRNFGFQGALSAGLLRASGDAVITIDADLQDPPEKIPEMIACYCQGFDLVLGVRADRSSDTFFKRFTARMFYRLLKTMGADVVEDHGDFRLMARALINDYNALVERNRFLRALVLRLDNHYAVVTYKREPRKLGYSKFNLAKMASLSIDGIVSFTYFPLRLASLLGLGLFLMSLVAIGWVIHCKAVGTVVPGWTSTVLPILLLNGVQMCMLGLIGEYIGRLYTEVKQRPLFSIRQDMKHPG